MFLIAALAWQTKVEAATLSLAWADNSTNETGFKIERKTGTTGTFAQIAIVGTNVTSYADSTLADGTTFCYRLRAFNSAGDSAYSNEVCATTPLSPPPDTTPPSLVITSHTNNQIVTSTQITVSGTASDSGRGNNGISSVTVNGVAANNGTTSGSGTANWSRSLTLGPGVNTVTVVARDNSVNQNATTVQIAVNYYQTLSVTGLTADKASPQPGGTSINFTATASGGIGPIQYKWWLLKGGVWSVVKDWSTSNSYSWPAGVGGNYRIGVWTRSSGNTVDQPENDAYRGIDFSITPLSIVGLSADKASPQPINSTINFTATTSSGVAPVQFKWWVYDGVSWSVVKDWSTSNSYSWAPKIAGNYRIGVWARSSGNTVDQPENDAYRGIDFSITPLSIIGLSADKASPQPTNSTINFTATTSSGIAPIQFKWWVYDGVSWSVVKDWSTSNSYSWAPKTAGNYRIGVWARSSGNTVDAPENNAFRGIDFNIGLNITNLTADKLSPQPAGTTINFTATASGVVTPIEYKWWLLNGGVWSVVKDWSTSNSYSWAPKTASNYRIGVWARSSGNTVDAPENNAFRGIDFSISASAVMSVADLSADKTSTQSGGTTIFVEPTGKCSGKAPCFSAIQHAIDTAAEDTIIRVAQGIYHENLSINSSKNITIEGGWSSTFLSRAADPALTVIDGDVTGDGIGDGSVFRIEASSGVAIKVTMKGFTTQNGIGEDGGGVFAIALSSGSVNLNMEGNIIRNNKSVNSAGGIGIYAQDPGANAQVTLTNNFIYGNQTAGSGGGIYALSSNSSNTTLTLINNTISYNAADVAGDGIRVYSDNGSFTALTVKNSIIWGNRAGGGQDIAIRQSGGTATVEASYSDVGIALADADAPGGTYNNLGNNINADPLFVDPARGNFHLGPRSPAIDAGTSDGAPAVDFEGNARPQGRGYDIGANERL